MEEALRTVMNDAGKLTNTDEQDAQILDWAR
jgi:hypothetical protein